MGIGKKRGKLSPFHFRFRFTTSGDVISGDAVSGHVTAPPQMRLTRTSPKTNGWTQTHAKGKQFLSLIRPPSYYWYHQNARVFFIANTCVMFGWRIFQQTVGIPMGTSYAPFLTDLFLYSNKAVFIQGLLIKKRDYPDHLSSCSAT